jgi:hypothetical protein
MFNTISWHSYWEWLAVITGLYYVIVYVLCFRRDGAVLLSRKAFTRPTENISFATSQPTIDPALEEEQDRAEAAMVYACIDEIKALFEQLKSSKGVKSEILHALQQLLVKYPALKASGYQKAIATVINSQCEHICAIRLSKEEVDHVWMG